MIDLIDFDVNGIDDVVVDQLEIRMSNPVVHVALSTREKVVYDHNLVSLVYRQ